jgi:L-threonylcarbamoyladenylate synthase
MEIFTPPFDSGTMAHLCELLRQGGVGAYPTETFYGLGVDASNPEAIARVFDLKKRDRGKPISLLVSDDVMLRQVVEEISPLAQFLMAKYWPGPLTLVFRAKATVSSWLTAGTGKIAVRISSHEIPTALIAHFGRPLTTTSANISGEGSFVHLDDVISSLAGSLDFVIDGGSLAGRLGSSIIDITVDPPRLLREGDIPSRGLDEAMAGYAQKME